jgi:hypothetical protein
MQESARTSSRKARKLGQLIEIIPKTEFQFDGRANSTQYVILKDHVPTVGFASGALLVRVHAHSNLTATVSVQVKVYNTSDDPRDPATSFVGASIADFGASPITNSTTVPSLKPAAFTAPISSSVRVQLEWAQGSTAASSVQKLTISVDLVGREGA